MKIKRLEIKNCLGIKELQIQAAKVNVISGGNERGKTSVLDCIEKTLRNTERRAKFVRDGEEEGTLYVEIDNGMSIDRKIKDGGSGSVKVTQDGSTVRKPETILKSLVGDLAFNPIDFMNKKDKEQTEILLSLIPMKISKEDLQEWFNEEPPVNLNQHALEVLTYLAEKYYYDKRALANGQVKECQFEIESLRNQLPDNFDTEAWRNVVIAEKWKAVDKAKEVNQWIEQGTQLVENAAFTNQSINNKYDLQIKEQNELLEFKIDKAKKSLEHQKIGIECEIAAIKVEIDFLKKKIQQYEQDILLKEKDLQNIDETVLSVKVESLKNERDIAVKAVEEKREVELTAAAERVTKAKKFLEENQIIEIEPLVQEAEKAEQMKGFIPLADNLSKLRETLKQRQTIASELDDFVNLARRKPAELLADIEMPVKGLGINDKMQITIDGLPIKNLSTSRQIKLALDIAKATSGQLKLICIDRFESLDPDMQQEFFKEIENDDFQYFITTVASGDMEIQAM